MTQALLADYLYVVKFVYIGASNMGLNRKPFMSSSQQGERWLNPEAPNSELLGVLRTITRDEPKPAMTAGKKLLHVLRKIGGHEQIPTMTASETHREEDELQDKRIATLTENTQSTNPFLERLAAQKLRELGDHTDFDGVSEL